MGRLDVGELGSRKLRCRDRVGSQLSPLILKCCTVQLQPIKVRSVTLALDKVEHSNQSIPHYADQLVETIGGTSRIPDSTRDDRRISVGFPPLRERSEFR